MAAHSNFQEIMRSLQARDYQPIYLLHGEEAYFIDRVADYLLEHVLPPEQRDFDLSILYGKEVNAAGLMEVAKRFPMMAEKQLVILREAQQMSDLDTLLPYFENPQSSTILCICYKHKKLDKRKKFAKEAAKYVVMMESAKLYDNQVPAFITRVMGGQISPQAASLLSDYLGNDLSRISNELSKLQLNLAEGETIDINHIEKHIGISKDFNVFELQTALGAKDILRANRIVNFFAANPKANPMVMIMGAMYRFFSNVYLAAQNRGMGDRELASLLKVHPFFLKDYQRAANNFLLAGAESAIGILHEYDLRSKGVGNNNTSEGELLKEMVYKLLHL